MKFQGQGFLIYLIDWACPSKKSHFI